jgi:hypothetical protein
MDPTPLRTPSRRTVLLGAFAALALGLASIGPASAGLAVPAVIGPADGASRADLPVFAWEAVSGADKYEFELAANPGFDSSMAFISTRNTRATLKTAISNGTYYWHVRAVTASGGTGPWTPTRSFDMAWTAKPSLLSPAGGASLAYPTDTFRLAWSPVDRAAEYLVRVATDPALGSLIWTTGPVKTSATSFTLSAPLAPGTYYWSITPLDAEGHAGTPSNVASFQWSWPSDTATHFADLAPAAEIVDPSLTWSAVPGAAGYEVEINSSADWAPGSKVCCNALRTGGNVTTLARSLSPIVQLDNNTYYWRVRAIDPSDNAGVWNVGPPFTQTFANVPPTEAPSVKNLRMRDNTGDAFKDVERGNIDFPVGLATPIVTWDPVPGASSYDVDVTPFLDGVCNWTQPANEHWVKTTSSTSWTPLGWGWNNVKPFPNPAGVSADSAMMQANQSYCVRVRPADRASTVTGPTALGDWTYLPANNTAAFTWTPAAIVDPCLPCALQASDYGEPLTGTTVGHMPLFTWAAVPGAQSYFVLVSRDPSFTNLVDYAFTRMPAYAPRTGSLVRTYPDESSLYYWAVLPASAANGNGVSANPLDGTPPSFHKQSAAPPIVSPTAGAVTSGATTFRWDTTESARRYRLQVAQSPTFANLIDDVTTDSTAYTSNTTYPADTVLYWRVRADADDGAASFVGLTWSETGTFQKQLSAPMPDASNPSSGAAIPTIAWEPVPGAVSYDVHAEQPDGVQRDFANLPTHAFTPTKMTGVGIFHFQVRANFPTGTSLNVHGPYSTDMAFTRTIPEPGGATAELGPNHLVLSWNPRLGARTYRAQVSARADFDKVAETVITETTSHAPLLTQQAYADGGQLFWRVAAVDADGNVGDWSPVQAFGISRPIRLTIYGSPVRGRKTKMMVLTAAGLDPIPGVSIRIWGAGLKARTVKTKATGRAAFIVRPRKRGTIWLRATKAGFKPATTAIRVRARAR